MTESSTIIDPYTSYEFPFTAFVKHAARALVITDVERRILDVNQRYLELTGFARDQVVGCRVDLIAPEVSIDGSRSDLVELILAGGGRVLRAAYCAEIVNETGDKTGYVHIYFEPER